MKHTPGPWRWELNESTKHLSLVGGRPRYDLTIIEPIRWGMNSATLFVRDTAQDGLNLLHKLHERRDWVVPFQGRAHHARWCAGVRHPDMQLIEAAPDMLEALLYYRDQCTGAEPSLSAFHQLADAAIAKATGQA